MDGVLVKRTSGPAFYRQNGVDVDSVPNRICAPKYELHKHLRHTYEYPVAGWTWFESEAEARAAFGLPPAPDEPTDPPRGRGRRRDA